MGVLDSMLATYFHIKEKKYSVFFCSWKFSVTWRLPSKNVEDQLFLKIDYFFCWWFSGGL